MNRDGLRRLLEARLCERLGAEAVTRLCPRCGGRDHGRPGLTMARPPYVSLSYASDLALAAWTWDGPIGVDVEAAGPGVEGYGGRRDWTRAEAILKATGEGLRHDPRDGLPDVWTCDLPLPDPWLATAAVLAPDPDPDPEIHWLTVQS